MKRILDIIRTDLITMNGGKNEMKTLAITTILLIAGGTLFLSPMVGVYFPLEFGSFFVPTIFKNEMKYNCEKMYSIVPIERKDLVNARYAFACGVYIIANLLFYLLMLLSQKLQLFVTFAGENGEQTDIIKLVVERLGGKTSAFNLLTVVYAGVFAIGLNVMGITMRNYFRAGASRFNKLLQMSGSVKRTKQEKLEAAWESVPIVIMLILFFGLILDLIPIGKVVSVIFMLIGQIASMADGLLLSAVFIAMAGMKAVYNYFRTQFVYEKRDI